MSPIKLAEAISAAESVQERISWVLMALKSPMINQQNLKRYMRRLKDDQNMLEKTVREIAEETTK